MLPRGFKLSVAEAAIKRPGRKDMALIYSEDEAVMAGTFTTNRIKAAPVRLDMRRIRSGRGRAVVVNSGNANACTGRQGALDARKTASLAGRRLGVPESLVYVCSTGVIGAPMPMERVIPAIGDLALGLGGAGLREAASAIMTTDTFPKFLDEKLKTGSMEGRISAICKGSGMIAPSMATMLCFVMTDAAIEREALGAALREAVDGSFNALTVDGCCSTNDTVLIMANGALGNRPITADSPDYDRFGEALSGVAYELARMVARDGEGATKLIEVEITGARTEAEARRGARAVAESLLVKTAVYGGDPNWGRIMAALGACGISIREEKAEIYLGGTKVVDKGLPTGRDASGELRGEEVRIKVGLNLGQAKAKALTCDLTEDYVKINAHYTT